MAVSEELKKVTNDVFLEIGKNVVLFQQIEQLLKAILGNANFSGLAKELEAARARRIETLESKSMGLLAGKFSKEVLAKPAEAEEVPESWISFSFRIDSDSGFVAEQQAALAEVVDLRNEMIHHFLPKWNWQSVESMKSAREHLIVQRDQALAQRLFLSQLLDRMRRAITLQAGVMASSEFEAEFERQWLMQSRIVSLLREAATRFAGPDGWVAIPKAAHFIHAQDPDAKADLKERYGFPTLKHLIEGTGIFDLKELPTKNGVREMYRLRAEKDD